MTENDPIPVQSNAKKAKTTPPVEGPKALSKITPKPRLIETIALWVRRLAWAGIMGLPFFYAVAALGTRWGFWSLRTGFGTLSRNIGPKLIIAVLLIGVICLALTFFSKAKRRGIFVSALAIFVPATAIIYGKTVEAKVQKLPFIHDVTTDTQNVPSFTQNVLDIRALTNGVNAVTYKGKKDSRDKELYSVLQSRAFPDIRPLILSGTPEQVFGQALTLVKQSGWKIHTQDADKGIIEATATTFWYGFKDDVIIRIRSAEGGGSVVDMRSISRIGGSDIGANSARIRKFMKALQ